MFTIEYKGYYIQGYIDKNDCYVLFHGEKRWYMSVRGAKMGISLYIRREELAKILLDTDNGKDICSLISPQAY